MASHVTSAGSSGIKFAFDVAMSGRLGMDYDLAKMSKEDFKLTQNAIADYKAIRETVQLGEQYRLVSPYGNSRCSLMYVDENQAKAVFFFFQIENDTEGATVLLQGLDPDATYSVREINSNGDSCSVEK